MPSEATTGAQRTLRDHLREATKAEHDRLDSSVMQLDIADADDYRRFLSLQLLARRPVEAWLAAHAPAFGAPPALTHLIEADLAELGGPVPAEALGFAVPADADPVGACWAIAGSSMGNRTMQVRLSRVAPEHPARFLSDPATVEYWKSLRPRIEQSCTPAEAAPAVACAKAVFATFLAAAEHSLPSWPHGEAA